MGTQFKLPGGLEFPADVEDLKEILTTVESRLQPISLILRHVSRFVDGADMDEVYPDIWLGDCDAATLNMAYLQRHGISHVLNAADNKTGPARVKTGPEFYKDTNFKYLGLDLIDLPFANVAKHFKESSEFIEDALAGGGIVLVHCRQGRSRSASIVIAFLMTKRNYTAAKALRRLREFREIRPNNSFLQQIVDFDLQLFRERLAYARSQLSSSSESDSDSEPEKESNNSSDSIKTASSAPSSTSLSRGVSVNIEESFESCESSQFESYHELSTQASIQLVMDSDYDSDDECSNDEQEV